MFPTLAGTYTDRFLEIDAFLSDASAGTLPPVSMVEAQYVGGPDLRHDEHAPANIQTGQAFTASIVNALMHSRATWNTSSSLKGAL